MGDNLKLLTEEIIAGSSLPKRIEFALRSVVEECRGVARAEAERCRAEAPNHPPHRAYQMDMAKLIDAKIGKLFGLEKEHA